MQEVEKFTYEDYIKYLEQKRGLAEEGEVYRLEEVHQYKDKGFKIILNNKEEVAQLINQVLKVKDTPYAILPEEITKYNSSFITRDFRTKEADIVYKKEGEDIFFLIEQQSQIDYSMPYRILNYSIEIIRNAISKDKVKNKGYKMPVVYPIVLYTGKKKWDAKAYFEQSQMRLQGVKEDIFTHYNLVDINNYTEEELWSQENFLSRILLLEKAKQKDTIKEYLQKIEKEDLKSSEVNVLLQMIYSSINRRIGEKEIQKFIEKMKNKKGGKDMLTALEEYFDSLIDEGIEKGMQEGMKTGMKTGIKEGMKTGKLKMLKQAVKNMIQFGEKDEKIMKYMGIEKEELERIKGMI